MAKLETIIQRDTRANQPAAGTAGRLYYVTDESVLERDSGSAWESIEGSGTTPAAHAASHASGGGDPVTLAQSQVTNLTSDLAAKAAIASPTFTGTPAAPTATGGTNTTQLATTAFVTGEIGTHAADTTSVHGIADTSLLLDTSDLAASHNHTSASADGGVLTNDAHDGYSEYGEIAAPSTPGADKVRLYAKDKAGVSTLYYKDDGGTEYDLSATGGGGMTDPTTTLGDLIVNDGSGVDRLPVGTDTYVLTADSGEALGIKWAAGGGGGGAPTTVKYVVGAADAGLSAELVYPAMIGHPDLMPASPHADDEEFDSALSGSWAWLNQGTAAQTIAGSHLIVTDTPVVSTEVRLLYKTYTAGNFIFTTKYTINGIWGNYIEGGLALSDGTKITYFGPSLNGGTALSLVVVNWDNTTSFNSTALYNTSMAWPMTMYLQIEDDGTNLKFRWSTTGLPGTFIQVYTRTRTTFQTATKIGYAWRVSNTLAFSATADFLRRT